MRLFTTAVGLALLILLSATGCTTKCKITCSDGWTKTEDGECNPLDIPEQIALSAGHGSCEVEEIEE